LTRVGMSLDWGPGPPTGDLDGVYEGVTR
jgi:hypothetical protein